MTYDTIHVMYTFYDSFHTSELPICEVKIGISVVGMG